MWNPPVLNTDRLVLRPIVLEDAFYLYEYAKVDDVSKYTLWEPHQSVADSEAFIKDYVFKMYANETPEPFGIAFKEEPKHLIGTVGCFWVNKKSSVMELAYALHQDHWGKGLVVEASQKVMKFCFDELSANRIQCRCKIENLGSKRVMEKLGMHYEGIHREEIFHRNRYWDMYYYSTLKSEFKL
jgi:ribosomal-protein-alanine N-acetyltransferase